MSALPRLGAHASTAGGPSRAFERAAELGAECFQIFVKSPHQWVGRTWREEEVVDFRCAQEAAPQPIVAHASYLINLAAADHALAERSIQALGEELDRCDRLELDGLVVHPGAHGDSPREEGMARVSESLATILASRPADGTPLLLELMAGQGTLLGRTLEELAEWLAPFAGDPRLEVCIDTCHAFAAGYSLDQAQGYAAFWKEFEERIGWDRLGCLHLNDSAHPLGSRKDRHANVGRGRLGLAAFERLVRDRRLRTVPMVLETPRGDRGSGHREDLQTLKAMRDGQKSVAI